MVGGDRPRRARRGCLAERIVEGATSSTPCRTSPSNALAARSSGVSVIGLPYCVACTLRTPTRPAVGHRLAPSSSVWLGNTSSRASPGSGVERLLARLLRVAGVVENRAPPPALLAVRVGDDEHAVGRSAWRRPVGPSANVAEYSTARSSVEQPDVGGVDEPLTVARDDKRSLGRLGAHDRVGPVDVDTTTRRGAGSFGGEARSARRAERLRVRRSAACGPKLVGCASPGTCSSQLAEIERAHRS